MLCCIVILLGMGFTDAQDNENAGVYVTVEISPSDDLESDDLQEIIDAVPREWLGDSQNTSRYEIRLIPSVLAREDCKYTVNLIPVTLHQKRVDIEVVITDLVSQNRVGARAFSGDEPFGCPAGGVFRTINGIPVPKTNYYLPDSQAFVDWLREQISALPNLVTGLVFQIQAFEFDDEVQSFSVSPDGQYIATVGEDPIARIWDKHSGEALFQLEGHGVPLSAVAFSPDGGVIATGNMFGGANVWNVAAQAIKFSVDTPQYGTITSIDFSPDNQRIAIGTLFEVLVLDAVTGEEQWTTIVHEGFCVKFSSDGNLLVVGTGISGVMVFDARTGAVLFEGFEIEDSFRSVDISPNSQFIAMSGTDGILRIWDFEHDATMILAGHTDAITSVDFSPDGQILLSASMDGTIRFWDTNTWEEIYVLPLDPESPVNNAAFSATGDEVIISQVIGTFEVETRISIWGVSNITDPLE